MTKGVQGLQGWVVWSSMLLLLLLHSPPRTPMASNAKCSAVLYHCKQALR
jgi:hypothetical protein